MISLFFFFFFNDTATTEIYTLSLHDALPIFVEEHAKLRAMSQLWEELGRERYGVRDAKHLRFRYGVQVNSLGDRKSTRLNSSHANISYAVFCLKKKKTQPPIV